MKFKAIYCYQYVRFQGKNENFISADDTAKWPGLTIELREGILHVKSDKDYICVFPTNVAYSYPLVKGAKQAISGAPLADSDPRAPSKN